MQTSQTNNGSIKIKLNRAGRRAPARDSGRQGSTDEQGGADSKGQAGAGVQQPLMEGYLGHYYHELAAMNVLNPDEELESARKIEELEQALWSHLLSYPQLLEVYLSVIARTLEEMPERCETLLKQAKAVRKSPSAARRRRYLELCANTAEQIHELDQDRCLLQAVIDELNLVASGQRIRLGKNRIRVNTSSKAFQAHLRQARSLFGKAQRARNEFVKANLRLVVSIARRFNHGRMPLNDLIQEGNIGLIKAVERFDYRRGYRFSTYASWWIRHAISRALADKGRAVRLPVHLLDLYQKVSRTTTELSTKLGRAPTAEEISEAARLPHDKVEQVQDSPLDQTFSLDRNISDEDDRRFVEMLHDPSAMRPVDQLEDESVSDQVRQVLGDLKPIEADVLHKRFGLNGASELTLKEIGQGYNLSRERIRQIQEQALGKIRRALRRRNAI